MKPLSESLIAAIQVWQETGVRLVRPATAIEIKAVIEQIGQTVSADVIQLYEFTGGFDGDCDTHVWSLWSLERLREHNKGVAGSRWAFADGLVDSFYFRLQYENESVSSVWLDHHADAVYPVAGSLAEFFHLYLNDLGKLSLI